MVTRMQPPVMHRREAVDAVLARRGDGLVVTGLGSSTYDVHAAGDHDANFYLWGAMGGAALMGLGLAQAQPGRPVLVITGDGEQLMALGALATIGVAHPRNLTLIILDNQHFGETGMQASHTGRGIDLSAIASHCGLTPIRASACAISSPPVRMFAVPQAVTSIARGQSPWSCRYFSIRSVAEYHPKAQAVGVGTARLSTE
jgi:thiamine pyrophosphate-dependent acetolactate synthase large subunit-like protein